MKLQKKARGELASKTARKLTQTEYHALDFVQAPFRFVFWLIERCKARLQDEIDNEKDDK
jgi:hypothetical protein